ncbi:Threonine/homoserine efflux transporter RhtA [Lihuaxuella thermophila]|uniref:Threonine/homoserine efflux transporter RhtA n=2 Tax=Lihuaxuella thermophila TaxID=1173111 RepID=A0A1H8CRT9_9BACL|nr:Threonine/homoserine efflux transporter RhtA [Lihuaxuella thermophila]
MVLAGASLWGISGTVAQVLFQQKGFQTGWLVSVRLLFSGVLLLSLAALRKQEGSIWRVWKDARDRSSILIFGLIGLLGVQYTYFAAVETGNATTATLLQFLGPAFITLYLALRLGKVPQKKDLFALVLAMIGTFLLVTNGSLDGLTVSGMAVFWGLASAVTAAFYTLYPDRLIDRWGSTITVGWGMLVGGVGLSLISPPWNLHGQSWSVYTGLLVLFVILFGTLIAFYLYLDSLRFISPAEVGILGSAEPLSAAVMSVLWLNHSLGLYEMIGGLFIIATVCILSVKADVKERVFSVPGGKTG